MADKFIILKGKNLDKLTSEAEEQLKTSKDNLKIEVIKESKGFFGTSYEIKAYVDEEKKYQKLESMIEGIGRDLELPIFKDESSTEVKEEADSIDDLGMEESDETDEEEKEVIDCKYEIEVSKDGMEAYLTVIPPMGGKEIDENDIHDALKQNNIVFGLQDSIIKSASKSKAYNDKILIAKGIPPQDGEDADLEYHFDISNQKKINISEDGTVDFKELSLIENVKIGQLLLKMIPATDGVDGQSVYGETVQARDGKKLNIPRGKNVEIAENGLDLFSTINGQVKLIDGKVNVLPIYEVPANVDNTTGNIKFVGKVVVRGNVLTNFIIEADDDVEVYGVVEGAKIYSKGNIVLHRGMQGMNKGELHCDGDLIAKFIENSKIYVKGNIKSEAIMHSIVFSGKRLEVGGKKGLLVGGQIKASEEVVAKTIGSPMATITEIEVGINPDTRNKYDELKKESKEVSENLLKLNQAVNLLTKLSRETKLPSDKQELLNKSIVMKIKTQDRYEKIRKEIVELENYTEEIAAGKIRVENIVYPGTKITIGNSFMHIKDRAQYATFYRFEGDIKIGSFEP